MDQEEHPDDSQGELYITVQVKMSIQPHGDRWASSALIVLFKIMRRNTGTSRVPRCKVKNIYMVDLNVLDICTMIESLCPGILILTRKKVWPNMYATNKSPERLSSLTAFYTCMGGNERY